MTCFRADRAFTLMELLVATTITLLLLVLANRLFFDTTQAVSRGIAVADSIDGSRAISERLARDFATMLGPMGSDTFAVPPDDTAGGVLIICNYMIPEVELAKPHGPDNVDEYRPSQSSDAIFRPVRSDQLVFIRAVNGEQSLTPGTNDSFTAWDDGGLAAVQKVVYCHAKRTNPDGTFPNEELGAGADQRATDWILARQALFLGEEDPAYPGQLAPSHPKRFAVGAHFFAEIAGRDSGEPNALYMGTVDYAFFSFRNPNHLNGCLVGADTTNDPANLRLAASLNRADYHDRAVFYYTYLPPGTGIYADKRRLHVNPAPQSWTSWRVAQAHPFLMEHVSDFIVEFAADIHTGNEQTETPNPDGLIDIDRDVPARGYVGGNIRWYGFWFNDPDRNQRRFMDANGNIQIGEFNPDFPVVYEPPDSWGPYRAADGTFVFRHDDKNGKGTSANIPGYHSSLGSNTSNWPYLLRIRFRMHDKRGELKQGNQQHGMWFEQIVRVPRP